MGIPPRLETPRDLVQAVLRSREVEFPLRALHRVPRAGPLAEVQIAWGLAHFDAGYYQFTRDHVVVDGSPRGLVALGVAALAQSVARDEGGAMDLRLEDAPKSGRPCRAVRIFPPEDPRPVLRAPRFVRAKVEKQPALGSRIQDRPKLGLMNEAGAASGPEDYERRAIFTISGTRGALRALAFLLFRLATDRTFQSAVELSGPESWGNLAAPSAEVEITSPFWEWSAYRGR